MFEKCLYSAFIHLLLYFSEEEQLSSVKQIAVNLVQNLSLRKSGGDLLRQAVTAFIEHCSRAKFPCHGQDVVQLWQAILGKMERKHSENKRQGRERQD